MFLSVVQPALKKDKKPYVVNLEVSPEYPSLKGPETACWHSFPFLQNFVLES